MERKRFGADSLALLLEYLNDTGGTMARLSDQTGISERTVSVWVRALRRRSLVHVAHWLSDPRGYATVAVYAWGPGMPDAPRPRKEQQ